jgi:hypothetical protein
MPRSPKDIAADLRDLHEVAARSFVPANLVRAAQLTAEFAESTAAVLEAAGLVTSAPAQPADTPAA